jgi:hypothetical protein
VLEELGLVSGHIVAVDTAGLGVDGANMAQDAPLVHAAPAILATFAKPP